MLGTIEEVVVVVGVVGVDVIKGFGRGRVC